ncbi:MAG: MFS transporter [Oscillospiraceae bacterium]|nr:MFS transporter [Oscillospiraceae bacterium]
MHNGKKAGNVFAGRNYRLVFFGALVSELGALLYSFAVGFYILEISGNNAFLQGLYLALCGAALLLFTPVGGVLGDRFNKAKIMYVCDYVKGGMILLATALMMLLPSPKAHLVTLFVLGILGNAVSGIFNPAAGAMLPNIVKPEQLQQANAYFSVKSSMESILGVVLAGVLYAVLPLNVLFPAVGACFIASGISEMLIRYDHTPSAEPITLRLAVSDMKEGLRYLKGQKAIMAVIGAALFINFFFTPVTGNFIPYFIKTDLQSAPSYLFDSLLRPELWASVFSVCVGTSSLIGAVMMSAREQEERCGLKVAKRLCVFSGVMIALAIGYGWLVASGVSLNAFLLVFGAGCLVIGFLLSLINIPLNTTVQRRVEKDKLSKVGSIISVGSQGMIPIASVLAGAALQAFGSTVLLVICAAGFTATAVLLLTNRHVKAL